MRSWLWLMEYGSHCSVLVWMQQRDGGGEDNASDIKEVIATEALGVEEMDVNGDEDLSEESGEDAMAGRRCSASRACEG